MELESTFKHNFACQHLMELPSFVERRFFYPSRGFGGQDGLLLEVEPINGEAWLGTFSFGDFKTAKTGVFSHPNPNLIFVVSQGRGFIVPVENPSTAIEAKAYPIFEVLSNLKHGLLVLSTFTDLFAYDVGGLKWKTEGLALDDLKVIGADNNTIQVQYEELRSGEKIVREIDFSTGMIIRNAPY